MNQEIEISGGLAKYGGFTEGLWWLPGFDHSIQNKAVSQQTTIGTNLYDHGFWGVDGRTGFLYTGDMEIAAKVPSYHTNTTSGKWVPPDFVDYNISDPCSGECHNLSDFVGSGHEIGVTCTAEPYVGFKWLKLSLITGGFFHSTTFHEVAVNLDSSKDSDFYNKLDIKTNKNIRFGYVLGISFNIFGFLLKYQYVKTPGNRTGDFPPPWHSIQTFTFGRVF